MNKPAIVHNQPRLYYLDWLRVIAFSILLFEHSAEIFVDWKFWIKNSETSTFLSHFIAFFLPWRMPLLFIISGAAVTLSSKRKTAISFFKERSIRLLLPLFFAGFIIIPPQIYFIRLFKGNTQSFSEFYQTIIHFNWHWSTKGNIHFMHLWYLAFLFVYCIIVLPLIQFAKTEKGKCFISKVCVLLSKPYLFLFLGVIITLPYYFISVLAAPGLYPSTFIYYFPFFVCGIILWPNHLFREAIRKNTAKALSAAILLTTALYYMAVNDGDPQTYFLNLSEIISLPAFMLKSLNQWLWVIGIFGMAMRLLNFGSARLSYATQAVYPFYILHETVIVIIGYYIVKIEGSIGYKFGLVTFLSFGFIYAVYELIIRRAGVAKMLFGIKPEIKAESKPRENLFKTPEIEPQAAI